MEKAIKVRTLFQSLLPVFLWLGIQVLVVLIYFPGTSAIKKLMESLGTDSFAFSRYTSQQAAYLMSILTNLFMMAPGFFWLSRLRKQSPWGAAEKSPLNKKAVFKICMAGLAIQAITDVVLSFISIAFPGFMYGYGKVMENLGMFAPTITSVLYTAVLAPVGEELVFRGLTLKILEKAFSFRIANLLQAAYFALIHGNLIQGGYAFLAGLIFGNMAKKYGGLKASILCHMTVNISGLLIGNVSLNLLQLSVLSLLFFILSQDFKGRKNK